MARPTARGDRILHLGAWELAETARLAHTTPDALEASSPEWIPAVVPGTVATSLQRAGRFRLEAARDLDAPEWWYRCRFLATPGAPATLRLDGLATLAEVFLNGERVLASSTMHQAHDVPVGAALRDENVLHLRFLSLTDALRARRPRPRWKTRLVAQQQLRWFRTALLGRIAGWTPPCAAVGPTREVSVTLHGPIALAETDLRTSVEAGSGLVAVRAKVTCDAEPHAALRVGDVTAPLTVSRRDGGFEIEGTVELPDVALWWPHTHGAQPLHPVSLEVRSGSATETFDLGRTGFRTLEARRDDGGFAVRVNGVEIFCRGACWMPTDPIGLGGGATAATLDQMRGAGMNIVRCTGTMPYEPDAFFAKCDELGILVWQEFAFANMDYPAGDEAFAAAVDGEARQLVARTQASPSIAIFCGGSEVEQQAAMVGMPRDAWSNRLFDEVLPGAVCALRPDAIYVRNSPTGGALPFTVDAGVSHYYGVGAYLRPLEDARRAGVRFTSECLGFSNVPAVRTCELVLGDGNAAPLHPAWKARVPRDGGVGWDFEDVRDHYLARLYGVDPAAVRYADPERYLALSREVTGEVMARTMSEWRRGGSTCRGAIVWFLRDLWPGAGWGVIDATGTPKAAWFHLRRALAPIAVAFADEGLNGLRVHAWNDGEAPLRARLRVALYKDGEIETASHTGDVVVPGRGEHVAALDELLGTFADTTYAYRFGPPAHDLAVATLTDAASGALLGESLFHPVGPPKERARDLGLAARAVRDGDGFVLELSSRRLAWGVAIDLDGLTPEDDHLTLAPGAIRRVPLTGTATTVRGVVTALNGAGPVRVVGA